GSGREGPVIVRLCEVEAPPIARAVQVELLLRADRGARGKHLAVRDERVIKRRTAARAHELRADVKAVTTPIEGGREVVRAGVVDAGLAELRPMRAGRARLAAGGNLHVAVKLPVTNLPLEREVKRPVVTA